MFKNESPWTFLVVQWLELSAPIAGDVDLILSQRTRATCNAVKSKDFKKKI